MRLGALVMAGGASRRFGPANKLLADVGGRPMLAHVVALVAAIDPVVRIAVVADPAADTLLPGFEIVRPADADAGLGDNVAAGARRASARAANRLLILLGDMPFVSAAHCRRLIAACGDGGIAASARGGRAQVPLCLGGEAIAAACGLAGERGLLAAPPSGLTFRMVRGAGAELDDIDDAAMLDAVRVRARIAHGGRDLDATGRDA